jgi:hypothetical protein
MIFIILRPMTSLASLASRIKGMSTRPAGEATCLLYYNTAAGRIVPWAELSTALHSALGPIFFRLWRMPSFGLRIADSLGQHLV